MMLGALTLVIDLTLRRHRLARSEGVFLQGCYPIFVALVVFR